MDRLGQDILESADKCVHREFLRMTSQFGRIERSSLELGHGTLQSAHGAVLIDHRRPTGHGVEDAALLQGDYRTTAGNRLYRHDPEVLHAGKQQVACPTVIEPQVVVADKSKKLHV